MARHRKWPHPALVAPHFGRVIEPREYAELSDEALLAMIEEDLRQAL
jgi:hypothetical protein